MRLLILCFVLALSACVSSQAPAPQSPSLAKLEASFADSKWLSAALQQSHSLYLYGRYQGA
jgi:outer membrane lipoprotein-sorting protein